MDRVLRAYAQTAWTALDPLQGLEPEVRRAILLMPSTFRERLKVAPWTGRDQRRAAVAQILAERRLMFELFNLTPEKALEKALEPAPMMAGQGASPYYQYRLHKMAETRAAETALDLATDPAARADADRREEVRRRYQVIQFERARLDAEEAQLFTSPDRTPAKGQTASTRGIERPETSAEATRQPTRHRGRDR